MFAEHGSPGPSFSRCLNEVISLLRALVACSKLQNRMQLACRPTGVCRALHPPPRTTKANKKHEKLCTALAWTLVEQEQQLILGRS